MRSQVEGMVLMTPFFIEDNPNDSMRVRMDEYGVIVHELAMAHNCYFVDTCCFR